MVFFSRLGQIGIRFFAALGLMSASAQTSPLSSDLDGNSLVGPGDFLIIAQGWGTDYDEDLLQDVINNWGTRYTITEGLSEESLLRADATPTSALDPCDAEYNGQPLFDCSSGVAVPIPIVAKSGSPQAYLDAFIAKFLQQANALTAGSAVNEKSPWSYLWESDPAKPQQVRLAYSYGQTEHAEYAKPPSGSCPTSVHGLDCSGLVYRCAVLAGMKGDISKPGSVGIPRWSFNQADPRKWTNGIPSEWGVEFKKVANPERGDLIYWSGHIGIVDRRDATLYVHQSNGAAAPAPPNDSMCESNWQVGRNDTNRGVHTITLAEAQKWFKGPGNYLRLTPVDMPLVSAIRPVNGPLNGGNKVTIAGENFVPGVTKVLFGNVEALDVTVAKDNKSLDCQAPAGTDIGEVFVAVTTPAGSSLVQTPAKYTYGGVPMAFSLENNAGPLSGGTVVTIRGQNFVAGQTQVLFGSAGPAGGVQVFNEPGKGEFIVCNAPAGAAAGAVNVTVSTSAGSSPANPGVRFTYFPPPVITAIAPDKGPEAGGTTVTITGNHLSRAGEVSFGGVPATGLVVLNESSLICISPANAAGGAVSVTVTTPGGVSPAAPAATFTYENENNRPAELIGTWKFVEIHVLGCTPRPEDTRWCYVTGSGFLELNADGTWSSKINASGSNGTNWFYDSKEKLLTTNFPRKVLELTPNRLKLVYPHPNHTNTVLYVR